jgi:peptide subunit release factor RF-3
VLTAVDAALMVIAAQPTASNHRPGACFRPRRAQHADLTFVNKMDREVKEPLT